jgi:hypothetical protein|tara:strand:- start:55 stop:195 length:141 start_codon:yes stop_codon:yes gene_type:complete
MESLASDVILRSLSMKDDEESVGGANGVDIVPTSPRPFVLQRKDSE